MKLCRLSRLSGVFCTENAMRQFYQGTRRDCGFLIACHTERLAEYPGDGVAVRSAAIRTLESRINPIGVQEARDG